MPIILIQALVLFIGSIQVITKLLLFSALVKKEASFYLADIYIGDERNRNLCSVEVLLRCSGWGVRPA